MHRIWVRRLTPSVSSDRCPCSSLSGSVRMKSRRLYWLSGTLLGSKWEGHPKRGRERFNLKSVQLRCWGPQGRALGLGACNVWMCEGDDDTHPLSWQCSTVSSNRNLTAHIGCSSVIIFLQIMAAKLYSLRHKSTSLLLINTWCMLTHTHAHTLPQGPEWRRPGLWWNR